MEGVRGGGSEFATYLEAYPNIRIAINGHTDNVGSPSKNMVLSDNRAKAVYDQLLEEGVHASRLSFKGLGETRPVTSNSTAKGRSMNRRTEFVITDK